MAAKNPHRVPSFCLHKPTGQGYVALNGRYHYLGRYDDPKSQEKYNRLIAEWLASVLSLKFVE